MAKPEKTKRGAIGWYFSQVSGGAKGALGAETIRQTGQFAGAAIDSLRYKVCPRCTEKSLVDEGGIFSCVRKDVCGFQGSQADVEAMRKQVGMNARVLAIAKGFTGSFDDRARGAARVSWMMWASSLLVLCYSFFWLLEGSVFFMGWTAAVAVFCGVNAIRYAYMAQRMAGALGGKASDFLRQPELWFVRF